jgi:hypothetical protein
VAQRVARAGGEQRHVSSPVSTFAPLALQFKLELALLDDVQRPARVVEQDRERRPRGTTEDELTPQPDHSEQLREDVVGLGAVSERRWRAIRTIGKEFR